MIKYTNNIYKGYESAKNIIRIGRDFEKSAYEMADPVKEFVETLKPGPGTTYDWVNAMGSGEVYGANSRGDYFPRAELIAHHKTFETNPAHTYVQHNNKNPEIKLGDVLFSHFNPETDRVELIQSLEEERLRKYAPDWVRFAVQKGENYSTSMGCLKAGTKIKTSKGTKNIEDIIEGDEVLTHTGSYKKVIGLFTKHYDKGIFKIKIKSKYTPINVTYEHPFYAIKKEQLIYGNQISFVDKLSEVKPEWIKTQDLKEGDYLGYGFSDKVCNDNLPSKDIARLIGYYLSDGYLQKRKGKLTGCIQFFFNKKEQQYVDEVKKILKKYCKNKISVYNYKNTKIVSTSDINFIKNIFTKYFNINKTLKPEVLMWPKDLQLELLGTFISGDGFIHNNITYFDNTNYELVDQLCQIACRNRLMWSICKSIRKQNIYGDKSTTTQWHIKFSKSSGELLSTVTDKAIKSYGKFGNKQFYYGNALFSKIANIDFDPDWQGQIYNFEVEEDESYVADNIVVHNCKVAYDECSLCHQKNKTVADYCTHLKTAMNDWDSGTHIYAINIAPNFFDNSIVRRGADKIARKLSKVASADFNPSNTLLTDNEFYNTNKKYFFLGDAFTKKASTTEPYINETNLSTLTPNIYALNLEELNLLSQYPLNDVLGTFKEAQLELLPYEYQHLVLNSMGNSELAENFYNKGISFTIPSEGNHNSIKLGFDQDILSLVENIIPYKTLSKPFIFYRSILEPAGVMSGFQDKTAAVSENNEILTYIGKSYVDYLNTNLTKEAGIIDFLLSMFMAIPDITQRAESLARVQHASAINRKATERTNPVGHLPFYNPLFRSEFLEKNSGALGRTWDFIKRNKKPIGVGVAGGVGIAGTSYLAGDAVRKELEGEDPAVTAESLGGMARRHPIATTVGLAGATYLGLKGAGKLFKKKVPLAKTASNVDPEYIKSYKEFLATQSPEFILDILENIPDNIFNNICYN